MRDRVIRQYCARVGCWLPCGRAVRQALLAGLEEELSERGFSEGLTLEELYSELGTPESLAQALSDAIPEGEQLRYLRAVQLCAALTALAAVHIAIRAALCRH